MLTRLLQLRETLSLATADNKTVYV